MFLLFEIFFQAAECPSRKNQGEHPECTPEKLIACCSGFTTDTNERDAKQHPAQNTTYGFHIRNAHHRYRRYTESYRHRIERPQ